ncbi:hypothetical protein [Mycetohabitans endofungorum]|uniref:hypothetical protein n=1 Tax=Mycetohabitans endofungorum TaxID=417203 RepID=UPI0009758DBF
MEHLRALVHTQWPATPVNVVGHFVGDAVAMLFVHRFPQLVHRIVNVEGLHWTMRSGPHRWDA